MDAEPTGPGPETSPTPSGDDHPPAPPGAAGNAGAEGVGRRRALSVIDQVCSSASNFLVVLLVARGATSTSILRGVSRWPSACCTFVLTMSRSTLGVPLGTDLHRLEAAAGRTMVARSVACGPCSRRCGHRGAPRCSPRSSRAWRRTCGPPWSHSPLVAPVVVVQDVGRYVSIARWRPGLALRSDAVWLAVILVAFVGDLAGAWHLHGHVHRRCRWGLACAGRAAAALILVLARPRTPAGIRGWLLDDPRRRHLFTDSVLAAATPLAVALIVTVLASAGGPRARCGGRRPC